MTYHPVSNLENIRQSGVRRRLRREYDDQSYDAYDDNYSSQSKSTSEYYEYGHGTIEEAYDNYEEEWTAARPSLKAPPARLARGGYREHPYVKA
ncbi:hypothetical protein ANANG_G00299610 [Anguilla anguilla]|uniref:Sam68 tyrosine-rich domain-containing protein n=1 Tax=Anguilla anguilla TaxID=7936 RepID=A0A9D3LJ02_ANGAN|nr:hypothetical protein ANANG_G00299610 [Anguilla anguilla]